MVYKDLGISIGGFDFQSATRVSVQYPAQISAKRNLGENIKAADQFRFDGPSEAKLSMDFLLNTDEAVNAYEFLFDSQAAGKSNNSGQRNFSINVGGLSYESCFIDDYSIDIEPLAPVKGSVNFTSYQPPRGVAITANASSTTQQNEIIHGHDCSISGANEVVSANVVSRLNYKKSFRRTPVYKIGDTNASSFLIDGIEAEMSISSTGLESLLAISGNEVVNDIVVDMQSTDGSVITPTFTTTDEFKINIPSGSRVSDQDFGVEGGGSVMVNAKIQNVIL
jgi:hypothetical protein